MFQRLMKRGQRAALLIFVFLFIEFLDEFIQGFREPAWPAIRSELGLTYQQIGLLFGLPVLVSTIIEPLFGIVADTRQRKTLIVVGGIAFALSTFISAISTNFWSLLFSYMLFFPASGAFVALSQVALMDLEPTRYEQNMARWSFAGSLGWVVGPLLLAGVAFALPGQTSWRVLYIMVGVTALAATLFLMSRPVPQITIDTIDPDMEPETARGFRQGLAAAIQALRRREVIRWLVLLEFANLMLDILHGYIAFYFVDVVGVRETDTVLVVLVWTGVGLVSDFLIIPVLERVDGLRYLRFSVLIELILFPLFLLVPGVAPKLVLLGLLGFFNAGWYAILQGQLYSAMPGQSGSVIAISTVSGLLGGLLPLALGFAADQVGIGAALWLCWLGPIALMIGLPRHAAAQHETRIAALETLAE
ncbi:MAG: MFS transporter [Chloroflexota bacterium]